MIDLNSFKPQIIREPLRYVIHGVAGIGKTTLAAEMKKPFILSAEQGGANTLPVAKASINKYQDLIDYLDALYNQDHDFRTIALDTADKMEIYIAEHALQQHNSQPGGNFKFKSLSDIPYGKGGPLLKKAWEDILQKFDQLRIHRQVNIVILAHSEMRQVNDISQGSYHMWDLKLSRDVANYMVEWSDMTLFADVDKHIVNDGKNGAFISKNSPRKAVFKNRVLYTTPNGTFRAKNRLELPEKFGLDAFTLLEEVDKAYKRLGAEAKQKNIVTIERKADEIDSIENHMMQEVPRPKKNGKLPNFYHQVTHN